MYKNVCVYLRVCVTSKRKHKAGQCLMKTSYHLQSRYNQHAQVQQRRTTIHALLTQHCCFVFILGTTSSPAKEPTVTPTPPVIPPKPSPTPQASAAPTEPSPNRLNVSPKPKPQSSPQSASKPKLYTPPPGLSADGKSNICK